MTRANLLSAMLRDERGASAAEFGLVAPVFLMFLLGTIDVGRFMWAVNENEKAAQIGARWAVATDIICDGLTDYSFTEDEDPAVPQGTPVAIGDFPGVRFAGGTATVCTCKEENGGTCDFPLTADTGSYNALVGRMQRIQPRLDVDDVSVDYDWSGLGYAGDPNGPDVAPTVTVRIANLRFRPLIFGSLIPIGIPGAQYSLTMEDGSGAFSN